MNNKKTYKLLKELDKLWINKEYELLLDKINNYSITDPLEIEAYKKNIKEKAYNFMKINYLYLISLKKEWYIEIIWNKKSIEYNSILDDYDDSSFTVITPKWILFIKNNWCISCFLKDYEWLINKIIWISTTIIVWILIYRITK